MTCIRNYLEKQAEISKELNDILLEMDKLEIDKVKSIYKENEFLLNRLDELNKSNTSIVKDRIESLRLDIDSLLLEENTNKDPNFRRYLMNLNTEVNILSTRLTNLNMNLEEMTKKHNAYINKIENISDLKIQQSKSIDSNVKKDLKDLNEDKVIKSNIKPNKEDIVVEKIIDNENELEFKFGSSILNILGVILILTAFITFGHYVYTNYMNDVLKGFFLFVISSLTLWVGEKIFIKKIPKFGAGILALGVGSLYSSLIVNYLVLKTIGSTIALILILLITYLSIFISSKYNSNTIRMIGLIGGYGCLMPLGYLTKLESYITIIMLIIIGIGNVCIPIKDKNSLMYSSILISISSIFFSGNFYFNYSALIMYLSTMFVLNNFIYIKLYKEEGYNPKHKLSLLLTGCLLISLIFSNVDGVLISLAIFISILGGLYYLNRNNELKSAFYCQGLFLVLTEISRYDYKLNELEFVICILISVLMLATIYITYINKDKYMKVASAITYIFVINKYMSSENIFEIMLYLIVFSIIIWLLSRSYKENIFVKIIKYEMLINLLHLVLDLPTHIDGEVRVFIAVGLSILYVLALSYIELLRSKEVKLANKIILYIVSFVTLFLGWTSEINSLISIILGASCLLTLTNTKYVEDEFIQKHKLLIASLYASYSCCMLSFTAMIHSDVNSMLLSVALMVIAFANVWAGFKLDVKEVRKYGLILSLIVCVKIIIIDFNSYSFIMKTGLFLVIGIIALAISYLYSKLENELKNKK